MAATLTRDGELTRISFPIVKTERTPDGDVIIYGKATDGRVDSDGQIVDPTWAAKAIKEWLDTGANIRVQHNPLRDPAGRGLEIDDDGRGGQWVKALIVEPVAKELVLKGVLRSYSVGIMHPLVIPDPVAPNGRITDGELGELSLVDRPANKGCRYELVTKGEKGPEWSGHLYGDPIAATNPLAVAQREKLNKLAGLEVPAFTGKRDFDRNVGGGVDRDKLPAGDFAGEGRSFPITTPGDVEDAARSVGRARGQSKKKVKKKIKQIAERKGPEFEAELPDSYKGEKERPMADGTDETLDKAEGSGDCDLCEGKGTIRRGKVSCPECKGSTKAAAVKVDDAALVKGADEDDDNAGGDASVADSTGTEEAAEDAGAGGKGDAEDGKGKEEDEGKDDEKSDKAAAAEVKKGHAACAKCATMVKGKSKFCGNCGAKMPAVTKAAKPVPDAGVTGDRSPATQPVPAHREPDGDAIEAFERDAELPTDPDAAFKALMAFKGAGVDADLGALHDLLCPAYHPAHANKAHPHASVSGLDVTAWQSVAMEAATTGTLEEAQDAAGLWKGASLLAATPEEQLTDLRYQLHKSFQDANPGPGSAPTPGTITPGRFNRPYVAAGNARPSFQQEGPNTAPMISGQVTPGQFTRGYLAVSTADDSPANGGAGRPILPPGTTGVPTAVNTAAMARGNAMQSMVAMHDHISRRFPDICPMRAPGDDGGTPANVGAVSAVGKAAKRAKKRDKDAAAAVLESVAPTEAPQAAAINKAVSLDNAGVEALVKAAVPDLIKSAVVAAVEEATAPLLAKLAKQKTLIKALQERVDGMADEADPRDAPWRGMLPGNPAMTKALVGSASPTSYGPAEIAARSQLTVMAQLEDQWRTSTDPSEREAAWNQIMAMRGIPTADTALMH